MRTHLRRKHNKRLDSEAPVTHYVEPIRETVSDLEQKSDENRRVSARLAEANAARENSFNQVDEYPELKSRILAVPVVMPIKSKRIQEKAASTYQPKQENVPTQKSKQIESLKREEAECDEDIGQKRSRGKSESDLHSNESESKRERRTSFNRSDSISPSRGKKVNTTVLNKASSTSSLRRSSEEVDRKKPGINPMNIKDIPPVIRYNISTRNSPRLFDLTPYNKKMNTLSVLHTRSGLYPKLTNSSTDESENKSSDSADDRGGVKDHAGEDGCVVSAGEDGCVVGPGEDGCVVGPGGDGCVVRAVEDGCVVGAGDDGCVGGPGDDGCVVSAGDDGCVIGPGDDGCNVSAGDDIVPEVDETDGGAIREKDAVDPVAADADVSTQVMTADAGSVSGEKIPVNEIVAVGEIIGDIFMNDSQNIHNEESSQ